MKVFISWSGERSRDVATALWDWLPQVLHAVDPFVSTREVEAGASWAVEIAEKLEQTDFGIVCVTKDNQSEPWLNYEAGAIAKSISVSRVVPLAIDLEPADIAPPLGYFQGIRPDREGIEKMVRSMNGACASSISDKYLNRALDLCWPLLNTELEQIESNSYETDSETSKPARDERSLLEEVLNTLRGIAHRSPQLDTSEPQSIELLKEDLRAVMRSSGVRSWGTTYSPDVIEISPYDPVDQQTLDELALLGKLRNIEVRVKQVDSTEGSK